MPKKRMLLFLIIGWMGFASSWPAGALPLEEHLPQVLDADLHQHLQVSVKERLALACNTEHRIASWVAFHLTDQQVLTKPRLKRITNNYETDLSLHGPCRIRDSEFRAYTAKGYDRGHMADAESFNDSEAGNQEVALTSNLIPQDASFNRGIWAKLEAWQRDQAAIEGEILVYVGPILKKNLPRLKPGISIPESFFRIIIDLTPPRKAIAFVIQQTDRGSFQQHWLCPAEVEALTGLQFANKILGQEKQHLFENCHWLQWQ